MYGNNQRKRTRPGLKHYSVVIALLILGCGSSKYLVVERAQESDGWRMRVEGASNMVVADGVIYVNIAIPHSEGSEPSRGCNIYALDARTGAILRTLYDDSVDWNERCSSMFVLADRTIYVATSDGNFHAIDAATGGKKWEYEPEEVTGFWRRMVAVENRLAYFYSRTIDSPGVLYALDAATGDGQWIRKEVWGNVVVEEDAIYVSAGHNLLYALDPGTGEVKWELPVEQGGEFEVSELLVHDQSLYFVARGLQGQGFTLYAVETSTGKTKWRRRVDAKNARPGHSFGHLGDPFPADAAICFLTYEGLHAFSAESGAPLWTYRKVLMSPDIRVGKNVYVNVRGGRSFLAALDPSSGRLVWGFEGEQVVGAHNGVVYLDNGDELRAVQEATGETLWTYDNVGGGPYSYTSRSAVYNGMFYYVQHNGGDHLSREYLYAIDVRTGR